MEKIPYYTAFDGERLLASGSAAVVALASKAAMQADSARTVLTFDDETGQQVDFDLRGTDEEIAARLAGAEGGASDAKRPGRPKLGVVAREVTLLPRHWEWLTRQPGGASVTLRKLVDAARAYGDGAAAGLQAQQAADRIMSAMLGNQPNYEDASRALYAGNAARFAALTEPWPKEQRDYIREIARPAFSKPAK